MTLQAPEKREDAENMKMAVTNKKRKRSISNELVNEKKNKK
jgi:hypothetical protein